MVYGAVVELHPVELYILEDSIGEVRVGDGDSLQLPIMDVAAVISITAPVNSDAMGEDGAENLSRGHAYPFSRDGGTTR